MIYNIRLSIADDDNYESSVRFDDTQLDSTQKTTLNGAISDLKESFDTIRDIVI